MKEQESGERDAVRSALYEASQDYRIQQEELFQRCRTEWRIEEFLVPQELCGETHTHTDCRSPVSK
jgi:hypothetical protein